MKKLFSFIVPVLLLAAVFLTGCNSVASKSWVMSNSADAFKVTVSDPCGSGTPLPQIVAGGGVNTMAFIKPYKKEDTYPTIFSFAKRKSMWGMFSNDIGAGNMVLTFSTGSKMTAEQALQALDKIATIVNGTTPKETTVASVAKD